MQTPQPPDPTRQPRRPVPQHRPIIRSKINRRKGKDEVVDKMDRKLAAGADLVFSKIHEANTQKATGVLAYVFGYGLLTLLAVLGIGYFKITHPTKESEKVAFVEPVATMAQDFAKREFSADQYALYLSNLLVRYDNLPAKYRTGVPKFTPTEIYAKLKDLWPQLRAPTKDAIVQDLPGFAGHMEALQNQQAGY